MSDGMRYHQGVAAEEAVIRHYTALGAEVLGTRCRTAAGEIDLVFKRAGEVLFVEVKARARHVAAAASLSARHQARLFAAAEIWLAEAGYSTLAPCRFDVATVDGQGTVEELENAFGG